MIDYILSEIINEFKEILVIANDPINFMQSDKISITEDFKSGLGPLGGVLTAMKWIKENDKKYKWISTFPSDTPFFSKKELKFFFKNININESKLFFIKSKKKRHNIFGLWSTDLIGQLETDLQRGERKVELWANSIGVKEINIDNKKPDPFFNINTKEDLKKANEIINND